MQRLLGLEMIFSQKKKMNCQHFLPFYVSCIYIRLELSSMGCEWIISFIVNAILI
jgi:hypothetical protein